MTVTSEPKATTVADTPVVPWLAGTTVAAVGAGTSIDTAGRVLRQLGAEVRTTTSAGKGDTAGVDVVLVDRVGTRTGLTGDAATAAEAYLGEVASTNTAVWVTASAYGLDTARADAVASELTLLASAGILGHSRIGNQWAPTVPPGSLGLRLVGYVMAVAALHALHAHRASGEPIHVDVPAQQAVIATGLTLEMAHALSGCLDEGGSARYGAPSGFFSCRDGRIYVLVLEQHQWAAFQKTLAPLLDSVSTLAEARDNADFVNAQLATWTATRSAEECERTLQEAGVPATVVNTLEDLEQRTRAGGRPMDLTSAAAPPLPAVVTTADDPARSAHRAPIAGLAQVRVLDAGNVLAVPLGAAWLGAMGAHVTKLEDADRLDVYRRRGPFADGQPGLNRSAYFNQLNFSKTRQDLADTGTGRGFDLDQFDVVLHNVTPRRAQALGVDTASLLADAPHILALSSSGFGGTGSFSRYRAYGHNIHAFSGLVAATQDARGEMGDMGTPWADPLTSVAISAWVLAWALSDTRPGGLGVDISMAELTAAQIADLQGADTEVAYRQPDIGGDFFIRGSQPDELIAISVRTSEEIKTFATVIGAPIPSLSVRGELVELAVPASEDVVQRLHAAGLAASPVHTAPQLARDEFINTTGLFQEVESAALGRYKVTGLPWKFLGAARTPVRPAPERPEA